MNSTNEPSALREVIRYYRRVQTANRRPQVVQRDWRSKDDLAKMAEAEKELVAKLTALTGNADVKTPEAWR